MVGPSGCGKTTLLRVIAGLERPDAGKVTIDDIEASTPGSILAPNRRGVSMVFQDLALWPHMTVAGHLEFVLKEGSISRKVLKAESRRYRKAVHLNGHSKRYPHELSGGEKQRLAIARALASKPAYLLMDEPFSSLDPLLKQDLQALVTELKIETGVGIIYVTHNMEETISLADRIAVMKKGRLEQIGPAEEVLYSPRNQFVSRLMGVN